MEQDVEELYKENVKRLEEEKYRCSFCSKLFRGDEFVRKHIVGKHMENITEVREKVNSKMQLDCHRVNYLFIFYFLILRIGYRGTVFQ